MMTGAVTWTRARDRYMRSSGLLQLRRAPQ